MNNLDIGSINTVAKACFAIAKSKGFHDADNEPNRAAAYIVNLHGEVSELWEAYRKDVLYAPCDKAQKMVALGLLPLTNAEEELADIVIRALDTAVGLNVDIGNAIAVKMQFNKSREKMHGKIA